MASHPLTRCIGTRSFGETSGTARYRGSGRLFRAERTCINDAATPSRKGEVPTNRDSGENRGIPTCPPLQGHQVQLDRDNGHLRGPRRTAGSKGILLFWYQFLSDARACRSSHRRVSVADRARTNLSRHAVMSLRSRTFIIATQRSLRSPTSFRIPMICSSVYRDRFIRPSPSGPDSSSSWPCFRGARHAHSGLKSATCSD